MMLSPVDTGVDRVGSDPSPRTNSFIQMNNIEYRHIVSQTSLMQDLKLAVCNLLSAFPKNDCTVFLTLNAFCISHLS